MSDDSEPAAENSQTCLMSGSHQPAVEEAQGCSAVMVPNDQLHNNDDNGNTTTTPCWTLEETTLDGLPREMIDILRIIACLHPQKVESELIQPLFDEIPLTPQLTRATNMNILECEELKIEESSESSPPSSFEATFVYSFPDEDSWKCAYHRLVPEQEREQIHLEVGRRLWRKLDTNELLEKHVDIILTQLMIGKPHITRDREITAIRTLCLQACKKAVKTSSNFQRASDFAHFGINLLDDQTSWREDDKYNLTLTLYNAAAEMEMCMGHLEEMDALIETVLANARCFEDKIQIYTTRILGLGASERHREALQTGVSALKILGEKFPARIRFPYIVWEFRKLLLKTRRKTDGQLLRMSPMEDKSKLQAMQILNVMTFSAHMSGEKEGPVFCLRMLRLTLKYGLSSFAAIAFAIFGTACMAAGCYDDGSRASRLALVLLDRHQSQEYLPRVHFFVYGWIYPYLVPIRDTLEPLRAAGRTGMMTGDIQFGNGASSVYCLRAIEAGLPLPMIDKEWTANRKRMASKRQEAHVQISLSATQMIHHLMGLTQDPLSPKGDIIDYDEADDHAKDIGAKRLRQMIWVWRMRLAFIFSDYELASDLGQQRIRAGFRMTPTVGFFFAVVATAMFRKGRNRRMHMRTANIGVRCLKRVALVSPSEYSCKLLLVQAELASVRGDNRKAMFHYINAMAMASEAQNLMELALSNELAARHLIQLDKTTDAKRYFDKAVDAYLAWGANAKVDRLADEIQSIYATPE